MQAEARPALTPVPGVDLDDYIATVMRRFANPEIRDTLARLCTASSDRIPKFVLPALRANLAAGRDVRRGAAIIASRARYAEGTDDSGQPIEIADPLRDELMARAPRQREDPLSFVRNEHLFGDLARRDEFASAYRRAVLSLARYRARETLRRMDSELGREHEDR
jgi:mannitol 2-dehydrogenase